MLFLEQGTCVSLRGAPLRNTTFVVGALCGSVVRVFVHLKGGRFQCHLWNTRVLDDSVRQVRDTCSGHRQIRKLFGQGACATHR